MAHPPRLGMETALLDVQTDRQEKKLEQEFTTIDAGVRLALVFDASVTQANKIGSLGRSLPCRRSSDDMVSAQEPLLQGFLP